MRGIERRSMYKYKTLFSSIVVIAMALRTAGQSFSINCEKWWSRKAE